MSRSRFSLLAAISLALLAAPAQASAAANSGGPTVPGTRAVLHGKVAYAPSGAPLAVKRVIWAANKLRNKPYRYGGGHGSFRDSAYDCSGAVSYALHGAGLLDYPLPSGPLERWGVAGRGRWISVYANSGHAYAVIAGLRFDTSGPGERGPRWRPYGRSSAGFVVRHPRGL